MMLTRGSLKAAIEKLPRAGLADLPTSLYDYPRFSKALEGGRDEAGL